jgi:hypothetical protein
MAMLRKDADCGRAEGLPRFGRRPRIYGARLEYPQFSPPSARLREWLISWGI